MGKLFDLRLALRLRLLAARFQQRLHLLVIHANELSNPRTSLAGTLATDRILICLASNAVRFLLCLHERTRTVAHEKYSSINIASIANLPLILCRCKLASTDLRSRYDLCDGDTFMAWLDVVEVATITALAAKQRRSIFTQHP